MLFNIFQHKNRHRALLMSALEWQWVIAKYTDAHRTVANFVCVHHRNTMHEREEQKQYMYPNRLCVFRFLVSLQSSIGQCKLLFLLYFAGDIFSVSLSTVALFFSAVLVSFAGTLCALHIHFVKEFTQANEIQRAQPLSSPATYTHCA